jgi:hypothetical protein
VESSRQFNKVFLPSHAMHDKLVTQARLASQLAFRPAKDEKALAFFQPLVLPPGSHMLAPVLKIMQCSGLGILYVGAVCIPVPTCAFAHKIRQANQGNGEGFLTALGVPACRMICFKNTICQVLSYWAQLIAFGDHNGRGPWFGHS